MTAPRSSGEWSLAVQQQAAVARLGQLGLQGVGLEELLAEAMAAVAETLGLHFVSLFELLDDWQQLRGRAATYEGQQVLREVIETVIVPAGTGSLPGYTVREGVPVVSNDLLGDPRFQAVAPDYGLAAKAAVAAPIGWGERPWGVLSAYHQEIREWTDDEVHFVQSVANTVGLAIQRQRIEHELRESSTRLDLSLEAGGLGAWSWDVDADRVQLTASALRIFGLTADAFDGTGTRLLELVHPDDHAAVRGEVHAAVETDGEQHQVFRIIRHADQEVRWIESWGRAIVDDAQHNRLVGVSADITDRRRADEEKESLLAAEQLARVEAELARERLALLAEASSRFAMSLDPEVILASLAEFCVPLLTDVCLVDTFDEQGHLHEAAGLARDDESLVLVRALRQRRRDLGGVGGLWNERTVAGDIQSVVHAEITDEQLVVAAADEQHLDLLRRFHARASMVTPLIARGRVIGVLSLIATEPGRSYGPDQLALVDELAARAALALDNGRLFESRNRVARSLQEALLPPKLPKVAGLGLAARYRVAEGDIEIGGDFYDVIEVGERALGVVVGDVCGRGPDAAALTGLMRHSVRTAVVREQLPSRVLTQTNDAVLDQIDDARFCTAAYLRLELGEPGEPVRALASSAGHPRPALLLADGRAELVECSGVLLGVVPSPTLVDVEVTLHPGDAIVLYTDGVTEARRGGQLFGEFRLLEALRDLAGCSADEIAAGIDDAVDEFQDDANDDVAILVVRVDS
jgi:PAS domain S-box-containing protein